MSSDEFIISCPKCTQEFPVMINSPLASGRIYGIEDAPLYAVSEVNHWSKLGTVVCIHCHLTVYLEVVFAAKPRWKSSRDMEGWRKE